MEDTQKAIVLKPVGYVENGFNSSIPEGYEDEISKIVLLQEFSDALDGIENNSHVMVLFWLNEVDDEGRGIKKLHPKGREDLPLVGVFATRSPMRPNPIGLRAVRLIRREGRILEIQGLDAYNGSPVLDIKPYSLKHDHIKDAQSPQWAKHLHSDAEKIQNKDSDEPDSE